MKIVSHVIIASKGGDDEPQKVKAAVFSNIALCHLKLKNYYEVRKAVSWNNTLNLNDDDEYSSTSNLDFSSVTPFWRSIQRMLKHTFVVVQAI